MKYKLVCVDIDGTLLDDNKQLLPQVRKSLRDAAQNGIKIAFGSGRMPAGVELIERKLGISCIKICNAGTYILMGEQCISAEHLSIDSMRSIYHRYAQEREIPLWIFEGRDWYVTDEDLFTEREAAVLLCQPKVIDLEELADQWQREGKKPNKLLLAADAEQVREMYQDMLENQYQEMSMARSAETYLEIFPKGINKGTALRTICNALGIGLEETIAIGDQELDIPMIEAAGLGIAMGNAIPKLKEKADFVTKTNNEAGVAYALEQYLNLGNCETR